MAKRGRYIVWEGSDGIGKSTQMQIATDESKRRGIPTLTTREPGGSTIGPAVRQILLDPSSDDLHPIAESHLFLADRVQLWYKTIAIALAKGYDVHSDRNWWSTLVYQGAGGKVSQNDIIQQHKLSLPEEYLTPDIGLVFYMTEKERQARKALASLDEFKAKDRIEQNPDSYFKRVERGYRYLRKNFGVIEINASGSIDDVTARWWDFVFPAKSD